MASGVPAPTLFRPPYGSVNDKVRANVPLTLAMWNVDPVDWGTQDPRAIAAAIVAQAKPGGVIDLHDIYGTTAQAIEPAIEQLKQHYTLVTFSEMFGLSSGQKGEYFGR
jgi:peptidoglycan/xylan/chitin deacetylase (PgdA/CDA1 family)